MGYCNRCHSSSCRCHRTVTLCDPCNTSGCPIQLDFSCVLYHKDNNQVTALTCLELTNGATLQQFAEAVDSRMCQLAVEDFTLPCLRDTYTINNLQQFAQAVDTEICLLHDEIDEVAETLATPITPVDSTSIDINVSGTNNHTITAAAIISPTANNQLSILPNGLFSAPQTLTIDYDTNEICITSGNCIDLSPLLCSTAGFLGNISSDPLEPQEGQYWYNTSEAELRIQVNNAVYSITITAV